MSCRRDFGEIGSSVKVTDMIYPTKKLAFNLGNMSSGVTREWTAPDVSTTPVGEDAVQVVTNKTFDADQNNITNISDSSIKAGAQINANKIANGSVSNAEFQYLSGVTGSIQAQLNSAGGSSKVDRQMVVESDIISTTSSTWIDVEDMFLTTHNLGESGNYSIRFNAKVTTSSLSHEAEARVMIGGVAQVNSEMSWVGAPDNIEDYVPFNFEWLANNVANGTVIKIQMRCVDPSTTLYMQKRRLIIDGVPMSSLV